MSDWHIVGGQFILLKTDYAYCFTLYNNPSNLVLVDFADGEIKPQNLHGFSKKV